MRTVVRYGPRVNDAPPDPGFDFDFPRDDGDERDVSPIQPPGETPPMEADWSLGVTSIPPNLAAGMAKCQAAAENVDFDATNTHHKYAYATAAAVVAMARRAMTAGGLALVRVAMQVEPRDERLPRPDGSPAPYAKLWAKYLLVHESGEAICVEASIDMFPGKGRPTDKAQGAAITALGKYVRAGICGIGWAAESGEDIDQRDDSQFQGHASRSSQASQQRRPAQTAKPKGHPNARYQALLDGARGVLRDAGKVIDPERFWRIVTGMESMPKEPAPHMLQAVIDGGKNLRDYTQIGEFPERPQDLTHGQYLEYCMECEYAWSMDHAEPNDLGRQVDARVLEAGPAPGVRPPEPEPAAETPESAAETPAPADEAREGDGDGEAS